MSNQLTELQKELVLLDRFYAGIVKPFYEMRAALLQRVKEEMAVGQMFQDPSDGTVFEITQPTGTYVEFRDRGWNRTRRAYQGEKRADLSLKRARESGYELGPNQNDVVEGVDDTLTLDDLRALFGVDDG